MSPNSKWEIVEELAELDGRGRMVTERFPVPGGWLYRGVTEDVGSDVGGNLMAMVFVPDPLRKKGFHRRGNG